MTQTTANDAKELAKNSTDCSFLLTHLIRQNNALSDGAAQNMLDLILDIHGHNPLLQASATGWYSSLGSVNIYDPRISDFAVGSECRSVCFTESTLAGLKAHRDLFNVKYGLAFDREHLYGRGAAPCINIPESILKGNLTRPGEQYPRYIYNFIPHELHPYINIMNSSFDATHEREWRHVGDLYFQWTELKFIFCPEADFPTFSPLQVSGLPTLFDLEWLDRL